MMDSSAGAELRERLSRPGIVVAPGVVDALTASIAAAAGFDALYLTGAGIAYTGLARPDIGLTTLSEVAERLASITERVTTPVIVDADTGYGNAINTQRAVRLLERAGAAAIQLEDQGYPKRCGHLRDKTVIGVTEMCGKLAAAADARRSDALSIVARTDAAAVEGFDAAIDRARAYAEAGADVLFVEAPRSREQLAQVCDALGGVRPLLANMVEGGKTPVLPASELESIGFGLVIFPGGIVRALAHTAIDYYASLHASGSTQGFRDRMLDFDELNDLLGTDAMLRDGERYAQGSD